MGEQSPESAISRIIEKKILAGKSRDDIMVFIGRMKKTWSLNSYMIDFISKKEKGINNVNRSI